MERRKLKCGGKTRRKALFGADGAVTAAAIAAAASMTTAATIRAAKSQAKAITESAKTQADSIKAQTANTKFNIPPRIKTAPKDVITILFDT